MTARKFRQIAGLWAFALVLSAALAAAGQRWPVAPSPRADVVVALLLLPPLLTALAVLARWRLPGEGTESVRSSQETLT
jgi:hypothetical protein